MLNFIDFEAYINANSKTIIIVTFIICSTVRKIVQIYFEWQKSKTITLVPLADGRVKFVIQSHNAKEAISILKTECFENCSKQNKNPDISTINQLKKAYKKTQKIGSGERRA